jgi:hypothetical protein
VNLWFVDDSRQLAPTRERMGPLLSAGGICVPETDVRQLNMELDDLCAATGFPPNQEFKWSPGRELWMRDNLVGERRANFFLEVVRIARQHNPTAILACVDTNFNTISGAATHELDVVTLLMERIHNHTSVQRSLIISDEQGGGTNANESFIGSCLDTLKAGTSVLRGLDRICLVLTCSSRLSRALQLADLFTSCITAFLSGENRFSPPIARSFFPIIRTELGRVGGCGVKLHPDYRYANLYYWLFQDTHLVKGNCGHPFPLGERPYSTNADRF